MKKICIVFRHAPHGTPCGREALDLSLLSASFEQQVSLIFTGEGILNLLNNQDPERIKSKDYISTFKALSLYDIDRVYVDIDSLNELTITKDQLIIDVNYIKANEVTNQLQLADEVIVF